MAEADWSNVYSELKEWQTGIGALLGFLALMAAALWNFRLNRLRDRELRRDEMLSVATALYGEILLLRQELTRLVTVIAKVVMRHGVFSKDFVQIQMLKDAILYPALCHKLGLLPQEMVLAITRFHAAFEEAKRNLPFLAEDKDRGFTYNPLIVLQSAVTAVEEITPALRKIEKLANLEEAIQPDLGHAKDVIEWEEEKFKS